MRHAVRFNQSRCCCCALCCAVLHQGYLNYQVIHHLFPTMPQCYGPKVSQELRTKAKEWGIAYTTVCCWVSGLCDELLPLLR